MLAGFRELMVVTCVAALGFVTSLVKFRLFYRLSAQVSKLAPADRKWTVQLFADSTYSFYLRDPYWNLLLCPIFRYEPEIEDALRLMKDIDYTLLDLGANYGYWSIMVSSEKLGQHTAVAVEPVASSYDMLSQNCTLNLERFSHVRSAISGRSGDVVDILSNSSSISQTSAQVAVRSKEGSSALDAVVTVSIDDLCARQGLVNRPLIIKLDIEGMEIAALRGAEKTLNGDFLLIYEDHGMDMECETTSYVLGRGMSVYFADSGGVRVIETVADASAVKRQKSKGYNFFAARPGTEFDMRLSSAADLNADKAHS